MQETEVSAVKKRVAPVNPKDPAEVAETVREIIFSGSHEDVRALSAGLKKGDFYLQVHTLNNGLVEVDDWINERY